MGLSEAVIESISSTSLGEQIFPLYIFIIHLLSGKFEYEILKIFQKTNGRSVSK